VAFVGRRSSPWQGPSNVRQGAIVRVFLAGASGVIGRRLIPLLVEAGHEVAGMTRSAAKADLVSRLGATPVVCDVFDLQGLRRAVIEYSPQAVMHQLTDLPDDSAQIAELASANARIRREGTRNLLAATEAAGAERFIAQSVAWRIPGDSGAAVDELEQMVLAHSGVVLRYGQFYGPGTYHADVLPEEPRIQIDRAAERTVGALAAMSGIITIDD
jgi:nucleoside-diphosphate-sugar epimerase